MHCIVHVLAACIVLSDKSSVAWDRDVKHYHASLCAHCAKKFMAWAAPQRNLSLYVPRQFWLDSRGFLSHMLTGYMCASGWQDRRRKDLAHRLLIPADRAGQRQHCHRWCGHCQDGPDPVALVHVHHPPGTAWQHVLSAYELYHLLQHRPAHVAASCHASV